MRLLIIVALLVFALAAALGFGFLGGATIAVLLGLISLGLALYMLALCSRVP